MATRSSFNKNNSAVKRIMQEARELQNDPSTEYSAAPLEDNLFEWHCTLRGAPDTDFEGGLYHFRILLPAEYPFRPPSLMMLTPNGRFETNTKLCISFTNYHEELWQPAWGVRTAIIGLQGFFPLKGQAAMGIGSMEAPGSERRRLAKLSHDWLCPQCKIPNHEHLPDLPRSQSQASSTSAASSLNSKAPDESGARTDTADVVTESRKPDLGLGETADRCRPASAERGGQPEAQSESEANFSPLCDVRPVEGPERNREDDGGGSSPAAASEPTTTPATASPGTASSNVRRSVERQVEIVSASASVSPYTHTPSRPPILLDAAISVLLVLVAALLARKVLQI